MIDRETMEVYAKAAETYATCFANTKDEDQEADLQAFLAEVPKGGRVLDLGCGPGQWAARLLKSGLVVEAMDASPEMADLAKTRFGIDVRIASFEDLTVASHYDGIWANFSLLHAPRAAFPSHLHRIHRALTPGGILHLGMKLGTGEGRDHRGRFYSYYSEEELSTLLADAGFTTTRTRRGKGKGLAGGEETFVVVTAHV